MKVGDLVELSQYGKGLNSRWREPDKIGIIIEEPFPSVFIIQWIGGGGAWPYKIPVRSRYDRRELKYVKR